MVRTPSHYATPSHQESRQNCGPSSASATCTEVSSATLPNSLTLLTYFSRRFSPTNSSWLKNISNHSEQFIDCTISPQLLAHPIPDLPYFVDCDASRYKIGCELFQTHRDRKRKSIGFFVTFFERGRKKATQLRNAAVSLKCRASKTFHHIWYARNISWIQIMPRCTVCWQCLIQL